MLDLDADPEAIDEVLSADPQLARLVAGNPGRRVPRTVELWNCLSLRSEPFWGNRFRQQRLAPTRADLSAHTVILSLTRTMVRLA